MKVRVIGEGKLSKLVRVSTWPDWAQALLLYEDEQVFSMRVSWLGTLTVILRRAVEVTRVSEKGAVRVSDISEFSNKIIFSLLAACASMKPAAKLTTADPLST